MYTECALVHDSLAWAGSSAISCAPCSLAFNAALWACVSAFTRCAMGVGSFFSSVSMVISEERLRPAAKAPGMRHSLLVTNTRRVTRFSKDVRAD